jgi:hypothetical protein
MLRIKNSKKINVQTLKKNSLSWRSRTGSALTAAGGSGATSSSSPSRHTSSSATAIGISAALAAAAAVSASSGDSCYETNELEDLLFTERYPGKLCALCNLSERSTLGQVSIFFQLHFMAKVSEIH